MVLWVINRMAVFRHSYFYIEFSKVNKNIKHKKTPNMT